MKTPNFYLKFAFKVQIIESVLLSFEIPDPSFTLVQLDRDKKPWRANRQGSSVLENSSVQKKILEKVSQLHD